VVLDLIAGADALIEGLRPGVVERLGIGPAEALARNPGMVYGRMTGWGQEGPYAAMAGHDIDYIAVTGVLDSIGTPDTPTVPLNLVGDFGGGGMLLAIGVLAAVLAARDTGIGQVVDAAMVDGAALLATSLHGLAASGLWPGPRGANLLDGGAPFYSVYRTSDDLFMAVGALEPQFFAELIGKLEIEDCPPQLDRDRWPELRELLTKRFAAHPQNHWVEVFAGSDACVAPVRTMSEARSDPHLRERGTFVDVDGVVQPRPAPRFNGIRQDPGIPSEPGEHTSALLDGLGYSPDQQSKLRSQGVIG
jgi:alpha-methylacyl-CoA racemase